MLLILAIPVWAGHVQFSGAGFVSFGIGHGRPVGFGVDLGLPYLTGGLNSPAVGPMIGPFARFGWGGSRGATLGARGGAQWMGYESEVHATAQVEFGATFHRAAIAAPYLGALGTVGWPAVGAYAEGRLSWEFTRDAPVQSSGDLGLGIHFAITRAGRTAI